jgi:hypothetical protein
LVQKQKQNKEHVSFFRAAATALPSSITSGGTTAAARPNCTCLKGVFNNFLY